VEVPQAGPAAHRAFPSATQRTPEASLVASFLGGPARDLKCPIVARVGANTVPSYLAIEMPGEDWGIGWGDPPRIWTTSHLLTALGGTAWHGRTLVFVNKRGPWWERFAFCLGELCGRAG